MVLIGLACRSLSRFGARTKEETTPLPRAAKAVFVGIKTSATPETAELRPWPCLFAGKKRCGVAGPFRESTDYRYPASLILHNFAASHRQRSFCECCLETS